MEMHSFDDIKLVLGYARYTSRVIFEIKLIPPANEVCEGYVFTRVCQSFCSRLGGGIPSCIAGGISHHALQVVSQHALQVSSGEVVSQHVLEVSRPTPRRELRGLARGGSPGPYPGGLQAHTWGVSRPTPKGGFPSMDNTHSPAADAVADPRGRPQRAPTLLTKIFLILCSFGEKPANLYVGTPALGVSAPSYGESCIRP